MARSWGFASPAFARWALVTNLFDTALKLNPNDAEAYVLSGEAKAKLNQLFDACNVGAATCPAGEGGVGAVAVELDGKVLSAPAVQAKGLASSPFQISGSFTQQQAQALAARLNG